MKILLINYEYPPIGGGAANATYYIAQNLKMLGHDIYVLTSSYRRMKGWNIEDGIKVMRCRSVRKKAFQSNIFEMMIFVLCSLFILPSILKKKKIDVSIVFFGFPCGPLGLWGKLVANVPYIVSLRGGDVPGTEKKLNAIHFLLKSFRKIVYNKSMFVVANSEGLKRISERADNYEVKLIPNGVDFNFFDAKKKKGDGHQPFNYLFVGRFKEQKNLFYLLKQMSEIQKNFKIPFEMHLVGDGPQLEKLKGYAEKIKIDKIIHWHGWCNKETLKRFYTSADCFLNPSLYEGMPNTVLEAMACGTPVIASNVAGNVSLVKNGKTGYLFDMSNKYEFQRVALKLMKNRNATKYMGRNCRIMMENKFSWKNVAKKYLKLCENIN